MTLDEQIAYFALGGGRVVEWGGSLYMLCRDLAFVSGIPDNSDHGRWILDPTPEAENTPMSVELLPDTVNYHIWVLNGFPMP